MGFITAEFSGIIVLVSLLAVTIAFFVSAGVNSSSSKKCVQHLDILSGIIGIIVFLILAVIALVPGLGGPIVLWVGSLSLIAAAAMAVWSAVDNAKHTQCNQYIDVIIAIYSILVIIMAIIMAYVI